MRAATQLYELDVLDHLRLPPGRRIDADASSYEVGGLAVDST
jgi:hypothetical protein